MMRTSGFLLGALLMLAVFVLALGGASSQPPVPVAVSSETVTQPQDSGSTATPEAPAGNRPDRVPAPAADTGSRQEESQLGVKDSGVEADPLASHQSLTDDETAGRHGATAVSRYRVWSPFHSEWAAQGFARRLALATGVPVEVLDEGPANYQVVLPYRDDDEWQAMVKRIETVTGLELERP